MGQWWAVAVCITPLTAAAASGMGFDADDCQSDDADRQRQAFECVVFVSLEVI